MQRYDGLSGWYDSTFGGYADGPPARAVARALGVGEGLCLDVGCGTGLMFGVIESTGRSVVGVDISADQLTIASSRTRLVVSGDAERLPFADDFFPAVLSTFTHTDVPDFRRLVAEAARVLRPGGVFVYLGVHPTLVHHAAVRRLDGILVGRGYMSRGRVETSPVFQEDGLRAKVGEYHIGLDGVLMAFVAADLQFELVEEVVGGFNIPGEHLTELPGMLLLRSRKSP